MLNPDPRQLVILSDLRKQAHISANQMARACGLSGSAGRESVRAWERGEAIPQRSRRIHFLDYLLDTLKLRHNQAQLLAIWDMLVMQWDWEPLSEQELASLGGEQIHALHVGQAASDADAALMHTSADRAPALRLEGILPPGSSMPYQRNPYFTGRDDELRVLAAALGLMSVPSNDRRCVGAIGMGGVGKTQLAIEFLYRYGSFFPGGVFWLSAEHADTLPATIAACGSHMALHDDFERLPMPMQIRLVQEAWELPLVRLIVFDNCEDPTILQRWQPSQGHARILVTSRRASWDARLGMHVLPLTMFKREESLQLLHRHCPDIVLQDSTFVAIAAELDDLPLALHLAGRSLARRRDLSSPAWYLAQLRDDTMHWSTLRQASGIPVNEHLQAVERTFALSMARLSSDDPIEMLARRLLSAITVLAHGEPVPAMLYQALLPKTSELPVQPAIQQLIDLGLLEQIDAQSTVRMHRLVAAYVRALDQEADINTIQAEVEEGIVALVNPLNQSDQPAAIHPFAIHLRAIARSIQGRVDMHVAALYTELGRYCSAIDNIDDAQYYLERAIVMYEALLGKEHPDLVPILHDLAWAIDGAGQTAQAITYHQRGLTIRRKVLGDANPKTAKSWNHLGTAQHAHGDFVGAEHSYTHAITIHEHLCGPDDPQLSSYVNNLGLLALFRGQYQRVYAMFQRAIDLATCDTLPNSSRCAVFLTNMGYLLRTLARYDQALPYLQQGLAIRTEIFGEMNSYTAISMNHLGRLYQTLGDLNTARSFLEPALAIKRETVPKSGWMSNGLSNMGMLCFDQGRMSEAASFLDQALALNSEVWGQEHWHTARTLNHLGILAAATDDARSAGQYFAQALAIRRRILGEQHPDTANTLGHLAMLDLKHGAVARANERITSALQSHRASLGETHPYTARSMMRLGQLRAAQGRMQEALALVQQALLHYQTVLGDGHAYTLVCKDMYSMLTMDGSPIL